MRGVEADGLDGPEYGAGGGEEKQCAVEGPVRMFGEPVGVEVAEEERGLEEDETGDPNGGGATEGWQQLLGCHWFDEEEKERGEKDCACKERT